MTIRDQILAVLADGKRRPLNCSALYRLESEHGVERVGEEMGALEQEGVVASVTHGSGMTVVWLRRSS